MAFVFGFLASFGIGTMAASADDSAGTRQLTVMLPDGGLAFSTPSGISCGRDPMSLSPPEQVCSYDFPVGTVVTLRVYAGRGSELNGWGGGCVGMADTCAVTLDRDMTLVPRFKPSDMTEPQPEPEPIVLRMKVGKPQLDRDAGTATLPVRLDDLANLTLRGHVVRTVKRFNNVFRLPIRPNRATVRKLDARGRAHISLTVRARSNAGGYAAKSLSLRLVKR